MLLKNLNIFKTESFFQADLSQRILLIHLENKNINSQIDSDKHHARYDSNNQCVFEKKLDKLFI